MKNGIDLRKDIYNLKFAKVREFPDPNKEFKMNRKMAYTF
jgi:hypothetical protein